MPSVKDAIEECIIDSNSAFKFLALAIPVFITYSPVLSECNEWSEIVEKFSDIMLINPYWGGASLFIMFALSLITTHNVINANNQTLPNANIFSFIFQGLKGLVAIVPIILIAAIIPVIIIGLISKVLPEDITKPISFVLSALFYFGVASSYILYSKNYAIKEAYNFKLIMDTIVETAISIIFCALLLGLVNYLIVGGLIYVFWIFKLIGSPLFVYILSLALIMDVAIFAHCLAQVGYEKIIKEEEKEKII